MVPGKRGGDQLRPIHFDPPDIPPCQCHGRLSFPLVSLNFDHQQVSVSDETSCEITALLTTMFGVGGTLFKTVRTMNNDGKVSKSIIISLRDPGLSNISPTRLSIIYDKFVCQTPRYGLDQWDQMMMVRDKRLTGNIRGQSVCIF